LHYEKIQILKFGQKTYTTKERKLIRTKERQKERKTDRQAGRKKDTKVGVNNLAALESHESSTLLGNFFEVFCQQFFLKQFNSIKHSKCVFARNESDRSGKLVNKKL
jgi:hypothetical protein